jgi:hypothetical protein
MPEPREASSGWRRKTETLLSSCHTSGRLCRASCRSPECSLHATIIWIQALSMERIVSVSRSQPSEGGAYLHLGIHDCICAHHLEASRATECPLHAFRRKRWRRIARMTRALLERFRDSLQQVFERTEVELVNGGV